MNVKELIPYLIVLGFLAVLFGLLILRNYLINRRKQPLIQIGNGQTIGKRNDQDDYFSTASTTLGTIAVLADGISGLTNGRMASTLAVTTFVQEFLKLERLDHVPEFMTKTAKLSNQEILRHLKTKRGGTTLATVIISDGYLYWGAVGDSMISIFRNGEFIYMNHKHTLESQLEEQCISGELSREQVISHPLKKRLINYLGFENFKNIEICSKPFQLHKKDKVLLCSDGIYDSLTEIELEKYLLMNLSPYEIAQEVIEAVEQKQLKNQDNATIVILEKGW